MSGYDSSRRSDDTVKVVVRVRPLLSREKSAKIAHVNHTDQSVTIGEVEGSEACIGFPGAPSLGRTRGSAVHTFAFDHVYDESSGQEELYETTARPVVESCLEGYNATIFAYGQTGDLVIIPLVHHSLGSRHGQDVYDGWLRRGEV